MEQPQRAAVGWVVDRCPSDLLECVYHLPKKASSASKVPWSHDQAVLLSQPIWQRQLGCAASVWYRGMLPFRGLGTAILSHLNELLPLWTVPADAQGRGPAFIPTDSVSAHAQDQSFLWAAMDSSLSCDRFFGCYWKPLHGTCASKQQPQV